MISGYIYVPPWFIIAYWIAYWIAYVQLLNGSFSNSPASWFLLSHKKWFSFKKVVISEDVNPEFGVKCPISFPFKHANAQFQLETTQNVRYEGFRVLQVTIDVQHNRQFNRQFNKQYNKQFDRRYNRQYNRHYLSTILINSLIYNISVSAYMYMYIHIYIYIYIHINSLIYI